MMYISPESAPSSLPLAHICSPLTANSGAGAGKKEMIAVLLELTWTFRLTSNVVGCVSRSIARALDRPGCHLTALQPVPPSTRLRFMRRVSPSRRGEQSRAEERDGKRKMGNQIESSIKGFFPLDDVPLL